MATEPHSANKSVALFTSKPMVFLNAATQAHNNHIGQIVLQALEAVHRENVGELLFATLQALIDIQFAHLFAA